MEENIKRSSPLWLEDGNVILTTASAAFKVHRGILERHSPIFRDIFSFPQSLIKSELEGAPAVCMYDEPEDLEYFLLALYDGLHFEQRRASNFPIIRGVLRLSIKYHVERLRLECLKLLQHDWPTTLAGWDLREREATDFEGVYESAKIRPHPVFIINLVHELGPVGETLLPAAFYDLSRYNCSHIWTGVPALFQKSPGSASACTTGLTRLPTMDLQTVMVGKEASQTFIEQFLRELERKAAVFSEHGSYEDGKVCRIAFDVLIHEVYRGIIGVTCGRDSDPLFTLNTAMSLQARGIDGSLEVHPASRACEQCKAGFAQVASAARCYVWDHIPSWFGLEAVLSVQKVTSDTTGS